MIEWYPYSSPLCVSDEIANRPPCHDSCGGQLFGSLLNGLLPQPLYPSPVTSTSIVEDVARYAHVYTYILAHLRPCARTADELTLSMRWSLWVLCMQRQAGVLTGHSRRRGSAEAAGGGEGPKPDGQAPTAHAAAELVERGRAGEAGIAHEQRWPAGHARRGEEVVLHGPCRRDRTAAPGKRGWSRWRHRVAMDYGSFNRVCWPATSHVTDCGIR